MGPATRAGCGAQCLNVNMPCQGCNGPAKNVSDQGTAMASALASVVLDPDIIDQLVDPMGTFYQFSLARSILRRKVLQK